MRKLVLRAAVVSTLALVMLPTTSVSAKPPQSPGPQSPGPQSPGPQSPGPQSPRPESPRPESPRPESPKEDRKDVRRLFEQPGFTGIVSVRDVPVEEVAVLAAEAENLASGAALARVTGSEPTAADVSAAVASTSCKTVEYDHRRGVFPYHRWIYGQTTWCYTYGGLITYRASATSARVDGVCSGRNARDWKVAGGAGHPSVLVQHEADFSCATPWWYQLNDTLWMRLQFDSYGNAWFTAWS